MKMKTALVMIGILAGGPLWVFGEVSVSIFSLALAGVSVQDEFAIEEPDVGDLAVITQQPESVIVCRGQAVHLSVIASGAISYQWSRNGVEIPNGVNANLTVAPAQPDDSGEYRCVIGGVGGTVVSDIALVRVDGPFEVDNTPAFIDACEGRLLSVSVGTITGSGDFTYQWSSGGEDIPGATSENLEFESVSLSDEGVYRCRVSNGCSTLLTDEFIIYVIREVVITSHPSDRLVCGGQVTIGAGYSGFPDAVYWERNGAALPNSNQAYYVLDSATALSGEYRFVTIGYCGTEKSDAATITVSSLPEISEPLPEEVTQCEGEPLILTMAGGPEDEVTFMWRKDGHHLPEYDGQTLVIENPTAGDSGLYSCRVVGPCWPSVETFSQVSIRPEAAFTTQPVGGGVCLGDAFELAIEVADPEAELQWYKDNQAVSGGTSRILSLTLDDPGDVGIYKCVSFGACTQQSSQEAEVWLDDRGPYDIHLVQDVVPLGLGVAELELAVLCESSQTLIEWRRNDGVIVGEDAVLVLDAPPLETTEYEVVISDPTLPEPLAFAATLLVTQDPMILDPNGDGCNTTADLLRVVEEWGLDGDLFDADGSGGLDVRDLLYINVQGEPCGLP